MSSPIQHSLNGLFVKYNLYKISAIALLILITHNTKEFEQVEGLLLEDWERE
jgi:predicted nucleic acid-binding protein